MGFFQNIFKTREAPVEGVPSTTAPGNEAVKGGGSFEERIMYVNSPQKALTVSPVFRALKLIMDTHGVMPVQYRKKDMAGGNFVPDMRGLGKRLNYLLQEEPNPISTANDMWEQVTFFQHMRGNGFVYIERDEFGFPFRLWLCRMGEYNIMTGRYNFIQYLSDYGYVEKTDVPREDVMHFPNTYRYQNGFWGMPTLEFAKGELSLIKTNKQQSLETAAKGGRVKGFISEEQPASGQGTLAFGMFNKDTTDDYAREINTKVYQQDIVALRGLEKFQNISMTAQDMQIIDQLQLSYDDVARYFGVPRPLLMLDTNSHYNDYQNATMEFHTRTILPEKSRREKEIARKLIGYKDYGFRDIHICEKPLLTMDPERQAKVDQLNLQTGAHTVNEIRAQHDMPAVENGDVPMASANLMTLDALIAKSEAATTLKPGNYTVASLEPAAKEGEETA
jgi:HK97 family phage portal protein